MLGRNMRSKQISIPRLGEVGDEKKTNSKGKTITPVRDWVDKELHDL